MDRVQLKMDAKAAMQQANPHPVLVALVYMVILAAISFVISMMSGVSSVFTTLVSNPDAAAAIYAGMMIPSILLSLVSTLVTGFLSMGFTAYTLRVINRQPAGINDLFAYARYCLKIWGLSIVMGFFVFAWSLLLWVPGIIAMYRYSQAVYIFAENPDKGIMECINESKAMMYGHKMDKFVLDLSFILWYLLAGVTCGLAGLYVTPYVEITNAAFYNSLKYGGSYQQQYGAGYGGYQQNGYQPAASSRAMDSSRITASRASATLTSRVMILTSSRAMILISSRAVPNRAILLIISKTITRIHSNFNRQIM